MRMQYPYGVVRVCLFMNVNSKTFLGAWWSCCMQLEEEGVISRLALRCFVLQYYTGFVSIKPTRQLNFFCSAFSGAAQRRSYTAMQTKSHSTRVTSSSFIPLSECFVLEYGRDWKLTHQLYTAKKIPND